MKINLDEVHDILMVNNMNNQFLLNKKKEEIQEDE